jgi:phytoene dehydrogenase-like protein
MRDPEPVHMSPQRAVVIGAGHNGLVCAIHLAEAGLDVTVLEQGSKPGGATRSQEATLPGFVHDHCAGFFPLTAASPVMRALRLENEGLEWINPPIPLAHPFPDGGGIVLHRDVDATLRSLDAEAPGSGEGWGRLVRMLEPRADDLLGAFLSPFPPPVAPLLRLAAHLRRAGLDLARQGLAGATVAGEEILGHERAVAWLCASAMHSDLDPAMSPAGAFGLFLMLTGHFTGWPFPRGGAQRVVDALIRRLERGGGRVRCDAAVERMLVRGGRAAGARLAGGEEVGADAVVSSLTAAPLARILPGDALPERIMRRLREWRYGIGAFKLDYALSGPVPWSFEPAREAEVLHLGESVNELRRAAEQAGLGVVPDKPPMIVGQHTVHDSSRAPEGQHTLYVYTHVPHSYDVPDEEIAERMEAYIEAHAPGFRDLVLERAVSPPAEIERQNPSMVAADVGGGSYTLDQQFVFRPAPELVRYRTPLRGLYVAGASVHPGGAVHGVSGRGAAEAVLADRSPLRFWR